MKSDLARLLLHPVRQRIVQQLILNGALTVGQLADALTDVPRATLYRQVRMLLDAQLIQVTAQKAVRGATQRTYGICREKMAALSQGDGALLIQQMLFGLAGAFARYFKNPDADPVGDMLFVSSCTLMLSDEEFAQLTQTIGQAYEKVLRNQPRPDRRARLLTMISAPGGEKG